MKFYPTQYIVYSTFHFTAIRFSLSCHTNEIQQFPLLLYNSECVYKYLIKNQFNLECGFMLQCISHRTRLTYTKLRNTRSPLVIIIGSKSCLGRLSETHAYQIPKVHVSLMLVYAIVGRFTNITSPAIWAKWMYDVSVEVNVVVDIAVVVVMVVPFVKKRL